MKRTLLVLLLVLVSTALTGHGTIHGQPSTPGVSSAPSHPPTPPPPPAPSAPLPVTARTSLNPHRDLKHNNDWNTHLNAGGCTSSVGGSCANPPSTIYAAYVVLSPTVNPGTPQPGYANSVYTYQGATNAAGAFVQIGWAATSGQAPYWFFYTDQPGTLIACGVGMTLDTDREECDGSVSSVTGDSLGNEDFLEIQAYNGWDYFWVYSYATSRYAELGDLYDTGASGNLLSGPYLSEEFGTTYEPLTMQQAIDSGLKMDGEFPASYYYNNGWVTWLLMQMDWDGPSWFPNTLPYPYCPPFGQQSLHGYDFEAGSNTTPCPARGEFES